ncbi:PP2C family protein-serine/threonine phosphatase [Nocardioides mesophilus]|uniref:SpoIIE family protein phosphatase n=1 Tax=Nocardioides mesophilus TaxID=433659 RepID=A0A7G9RBM4_9ACTN|nr:SpoIIE family protein phosphatase [Nocardioides mesophilus]QNN52999.1 SpoIIE family protein phosphatase [Nocardioides mesophilus]
MSTQAVASPAVTEEARLQALAALRVLDTPPEERFDRLVRLAQRMFDVPTVLVTLVDEDRQFHKAEIGFGRAEIPRSQSFCTFTIDAAEPMVVNDAENDPRFRENPLVTGADHVRFYAGQPLTTPAGVPVGALCLLDSKPREITEDQLWMLRELADLVEVELAHTDELRRAGEVQQGLLPAEVPALPGYTVAGVCVPAAAVGGDFYDWHPALGGYQFVVADVMGKGVAAALIGAGARAVLRGTSQFNDLCTSVDRTAVALGPDLDRTSSFVTLFAARLDQATHELTYVDAGHGIAGVVRADGSAERFESEGLPLGVPTDSRRPAGTVMLHPGDTFICLSDGLLDLFDSIEEAIEAARITVVDYRTPRAIVDTVEGYGREHLASDDITCVVVQRDPT